MHCVVNVGEGLCLGVAVGYAARQFLDIREPILAIAVIAALKPGVVGQLHVGVDVHG